MNYPKLKAHINIDKVSESRQRRCLALGAVFEVVVNHEMFKTEFLNRVEGFRRGERSDWQCVPAEEILAKIFDGAEEWNGEVDNEADIYFEDYESRFSKVIGYMIPGKKTIHINNKYHDGMVEWERLGNMMHEWFHTLGFRHDGKHFRRSFSYLANKIAEIVYKYLEDQGLLPYAPLWKKVYKRHWWYYLGLRKKYYFVKVN